MKADWGKQQSRLVDNEILVALERVLELVGSEWMDLGRREFFRIRGIEDSILFAAKITGQKRTVTGEEDVPHEIFVVIDKLANVSRDAGIVRIALVVVLIELLIELLGLGANVVHEGFLRRVSAISKAKRKLITHCCWKRSLAAFTFSSSWARSFKF